MKRTIFLIVTAVLLLSVAFNAMAASMIGPNVYVTLATATKTSSTDQLGVTISSARVENTEYWIWFWAKHNPSGDQASYSYRIVDGDTGVQSRMYLKPAYVIVGDSYSARARSHENMDIGEKSIISLSRFVP